MSREIKEKPMGAKGTGRKLHVVPKEFMRRQLANGKERAKTQVNDAEAAQERPEDYGDEKLEGGIQSAASFAGRGIEAIAGTPRLIKAKGNETAQGRGVPPETRKTRPETDARTVKEKATVPLSGTPAELGKRKAVRNARERIRMAQTAAKPARQAARTAERASATAARSIGNAIRLAADALRDMLTMLAAGSAPALAIVVALCLAALLLATPFGIFLAGEPSDIGETVQTAVTSLNGEFCLVIEQIIENNPHDELVMDNDGVAAMIANWNDALAVYAVLVTTDETTPADAATMTPEKLDVLRRVFWDMNRIAYDLETTTDPDTEESTTSLTIAVTVRGKDEMAAEYGFTAEQLSLLAELTQPEYESLFAAVKGSDDSLRPSSRQKQRILAQLPADLSEERRQVVLTAYQLLGKVNYHWGGKSLVLGWDSRWGTPRIVAAAGSSTTGTMRPYGLDCSGFVDWVFYNVSNGAYVLGRGGGASVQHAYCADVPWTEAKPGDLAFYPDDSHVGIICGYDEAGNVQIIHCAYSANNVVVTGKSGFTTVGRPYYYSE